MTILYSQGIKTLEESSHMSSPRLISRHYEVLADLLLMLATHTPHTAGCVVVGATLLVVVIEDFGVVLGVANIDFPDDIVVTLVLLTFVFVGVLLEVVMLGLIEVVVNFVDDLVVVVVVAAAVVLTDDFNVGQVTS